MRVYERPVGHVAGVGPKRQAQFATLGIHTVNDLMWYSPIRYDDRKLQNDVALVDGQRYTVVVTVASPPTVRYRGKRSTVSVACRLANGQAVRGVWFNRPYVRDQLPIGRSLAVTGRYDEKRQTLTVEHFEPIEGGPSIHSDRVVPVYGVTDGLSIGQLRATIAMAFRQYEADIEETLPIALRRKYQLTEKRDALRELHFPTNGSSLTAARRRLMFEEFFLFQLKLQAFRVLHRQSAPSCMIEDAAQKARPFLDQLPYTLTRDQVASIEGISRDLAQPRAMNRLLQGDVGSGKTAVAFALLYAVAVSGYQGALMAPTEILAEQHYQLALRWLVPLGCTVHLLKGQQSAPERERTLLALRSGAGQIVIGTHALIEEDVVFRRLGLVVTDEQHRFGVRQRKIFRQKGQSPHVLFLSATPIPRTLALTLFGDLDMTSLRERPPGRIPIQTRWVKPDREEDVVRFVRRELAKGRQAYIVAPLIESSEKLAQVTDVTALSERLREAFAGYVTGVLHGQMSATEKDATMKAFVNGAVHVLVATTVIEVGVDVPNASVIVIYDAERFGLAQLHQLRGRVGRGSYASHCILISSGQSATAEERLRAMEETDDGFELAERDLGLRGPGELFGYRQSGLPHFRVGDLVRDMKAMTVAREEAAALVESRNFWVLPAYTRLVDYLKYERIVDGPAAD